MGRYTGRGNASCIAAGWIICAALALALGGCAGGASSSATTAKANAPLTIGSLQRQIAALPCPAGVSVELWDTLTAELLGRLERRVSAQAIVAHPPLDEHSAVNDLRATEPTSGDIRLRWSYLNTGDYDQNGEANISDLTPIGVHFSKNPTAADWPTAQMADGDFNTEVNISDITPLGLHFMQSVTSYHVEFSATGETSGFTALGEVQLSEGAEDTRGWLTFDETLAAPGSGYYRVVPYYYDERGIDGLPVYFGLNQPPTAVLTANPQAGQTPLMVNFDASGSSDPEHGPLTFSWDWEGDGVVDHESGTNSQVHHEFKENGDFAPVVYVCDSKGAESSASLFVYCYTWSVYEVSSEHGVQSAAIIDGRPAFIHIYRQYKDGGPAYWRLLGYTQSKVAVPSSPSDWECTIARDPVPFGDAGLTDSINGFPVLFELDGRPAVVEGLRNPLYTWDSVIAAESRPSGPADWSVSKIIDDPYTLNGSDALAACAVGDRAYVLIKPNCEADMLLARALVAEPKDEADWDITTIDTGFEQISPRCASLAYVNGKLRLAYGHSTNNPAYAVCQSLAPAGPHDWQVTILDDPELNFSIRPMIAEHEGALLMLYGASDEEGRDYVRLARARSPEPETAGDWTISTPVEGLESGSFAAAFTHSSCAIVASNKCQSGKWEMLALRPAAPGLESLSQPWVAQRIYPDLIVDYPSAHEMLISAGSIICFFSDNGSGTWPDVWSYKCATADVTPLYIP